MPLSPRPTFRPIAAADVPAAAGLLDGHERWRESGYADALEEVSTGAGEHRALVAIRGGLTGVCIYRMVAGAVGTGEIECVCSTSPEDERGLIEAAVGRLRDEGARLVVAEYPTTYTEFASRLSECGFIVTAVAHDIIADGVGLAIATRSARGS